MDQPVEEGTGSEDDGGRSEPNAQLRDHTGDPVAFDADVIHRLLEQGQIGLVLQPLADRRLVEHTVRLGARGAHRRTLRGVENAELNAAFVGGRGHRTTERVDFLDQMPFADAADRRIATHLTQRLDIVRKQQGAHAHARRGQRGLGAGMAAANNNHIESIGVEHDASCIVATSEQGRDSTVSVLAKPAWHRDVSRVSVVET